MSCPASGSYGESNTQSASEVFRAGKRQFWFSGVDQCTSKPPCLGLHRALGPAHLFFTCFLQGTRKRSVNTGSEPSTDTRSTSGIEFSSPDRSTSYPLACSSPVLFRSHSGVAGSASL